MTMITMMTKITRIIKLIPLEIDCSTNDEYSHSTTRLFWNYYCQISTCSLSFKDQIYQIRVIYFRLRAIYAEAAAVIHAIEQLSNRAIEPSKQKSHCATRFWQDTRYVANTHFFATATVYSILATIYCIFDIFVSYCIFGWFNKEFSFIYVQKTQHNFTWVNLGVFLLSNVLTNNWRVSAEPAHTKSSGL